MPDLEVRTLKDPETVKLQVALDKFRRTANFLAEMQIEVAGIRKKAFDAHVKAGFTPAQALELVKSLTI